MKAQVISRSERQSLIRAATGEAPSAQVSQDLEAIFARTRQPEKVFTKYDDQAMDKAEEKRRRKAERRR